MTSAKFKNNIKLIDLIYTYLTFLLQKGRFKPTSDFHRVLHCLELRTFTPVVTTHPFCA